MRDIQGTKYLVVLEFGSGWPVRRERFGPVVSTWDDAMTLCAAAAREVPGFTRYLVLHSQDEYKLEQAYDQIKLGGGITAQFVTPDQAEIERRKLEDGLGGDHDEPYVFEMPVWAPTIAKWAELLAQVYDGTLGGENDGNADDSPPEGGS